MYNSRAEGIVLCANTPLTTLAVGGYGPAGGEKHGTREVRLQEGQVLVMGGGS